MPLSVTAAAICFIACHGGAANHFATFADDLMSKGYRVQICATGPALKKFQDAGFTDVIPFSLEEGESEQQVARDIAKKCSQVAVVITDVGHAFDISLQKALADHAPKANACAYYDNPESYVPGGYSQVASQVMQLAKTVLFANANLAETFVYENCVGIGFYPLNQAEEIARRRSLEKEQIRQQFFARHQIDDAGQKVLVFSGGNNEEYFSKAFPAFLDFLTTLNKDEQLSDYIVVLQQHPGARKENRDIKCMQEKNDANLPQILISDVSTEDALVLADTVLYHQTSMGPQFVLAGIPTIQVAHEPYDDILVKNGLCLVANSGKELWRALTNVKELKSKRPNDTIKQGLGLCPNWAERLESLVTSMPFR